MHARIGTLTTVAALLLLSLAPVAFGQLPTARGQALSLSRSQWRLFLPEGLEARPDGGVDLLVHFHGDPQTVWNNAAYAELNAAIVTVNYSGLSSAYRVPFEDRSLFQQLLNDARATLAARPGFGAETDWDGLAVSSFSAGYGAVREILAARSYLGRIDSLLAADSLYATTASDGTALDSQMARYKSFADLAAAGTKRFIFTHSEVLTFTYESTRETGDELLQHLNLLAEPTGETGLGPLEYNRRAKRGGFELWGADGAGAEDHLNHLRYLGEWLGDLGIGAATLPGDFNADGVVDAADYTVWRDGLGEQYIRADYDLWAENFGESISGAAVVPEPASSALAIALAALFAVRRLR
ncbi:MAG: hypothetical protein AAGJ46_04910 [Planctomycetota bacterium]